MEVSARGCHLDTVFVQFAVETCHAGFADQVCHNLNMPTIATVHRDRKARPSRLSKSPRFSPTLLEMHAANGYSDLRTLGEQVCAIKQFNFTTAVVVGLDSVGYQRRYCYELKSDAQAALIAWDGREHPFGPWIKCKGSGIDLLNPNFR